MGRKKLDKGQNGNKEKRMTPFNKKKTNSIMKKAYELSTLCDIQVCVIIYGPKGGAPYVWPEEPEKRNNILARYMNTPLEERRKRALNLSTLPKKSQKGQVLDVSNDKQVENLPKIGFPGDDRDQLIELAKQLDNKIKIVKGRIDMMRSLNQKLENTQYYYGGEEQNMMPLQYQCQNHYYLEEQRRNTEATTTMIMTNNGGFNSLNNNNNNVNVDDYNGYIGRNMVNSNNVTWDASSLTWRDPQPQLQLQAPHQFYGTPQGQQPFKYEYSC